MWVPFHLSHPNNSFCKCLFQSFAHLFQNWVPSVFIVLFWHLLYTLDTSPLSVLSNADTLSSVSLAYLLEVSFDEQRFSFNEEQFISLIWLVLIVSCLKKKKSLPTKGSHRYFSRFSLETLFLTLHLISIAPSKHTYITSVIKLFQETEKGKLHNSFYEFHNFKHKCTHINLW